MAIHMELEIAGQDYKLTLSRDDAGNYVAEGVRLVRGPTGAQAPRVRVVERVKERALRSLLEALARAEADRGDAPAAA